MPPDRADVHHSPLNAGHIASSFFSSGAPAYRKPVSLNATTGAANGQQGVAKRNRPASLTLRDTF